MLSVLDGDVLLAQAELVRRSLAWISREFAERGSHPPIAILAHSMGGIASLEAWMGGRSWMADAGVEGRIGLPSTSVPLSAVVTLGTPFQRDDRFVTAVSSSLSRLYARHHRF